VSIEEITKFHYTKITSTSAYSELPQKRNARAEPTPPPLRLCRSGGESPLSSLPSSLVLSAHLDKISSFLFRRDWLPGLGKGGRGKRRQLFQSLQHQFSCSPL